MHPRKKERREQKKKKENCARHCISRERERENRLCVCPDDDNLFTENRLHSDSNEESLTLLYTPRKPFLTLVSLVPEALNDTRHITPKPPPPPHSVYFSARSTKSNENYHKY